MGIKIIKQLEKPKLADLSISTRVAGVVVLYKSPCSSLEALKTYWNQVEKLYIVDNSPIALEWVSEVLDMQSNLEYIHLSHNPGIATALNVAAQKAINEGFSFILTMDDDSLAPPDMVSRMRLFFEANHDMRIGIVSPRHMLTTAPRHNSFTNDTVHEQALITMTSGNLLNLAVFQEVGPFRDDFFIDAIDHEYCLRMRKFDYLTIVLPQLQLTHRLGSKKKRFGRSFISHSPLRNYYIVRNSIITAKLYRQVMPVYQHYAIKITCIVLVKAIALENKTFKRVRYIWQGIMDGLKAQSGKF